MHKNEKEIWYFVGKTTNRNRKYLSLFCHNIHNQISDQNVRYFREIKYKTIINNEYKHQATSSSHLSTFEFHSHVYFDMALCVYKVSFVANNRNQCRIPDVVSYAYFDESFYFNETSWLPHRFSTYSRDTISLCFFRQNVYFPEFAIQNKYKTLELYIV